MKKKATQNDKQNFVEKLNKVIDQLRKCGEVKCIENSYNNFIKSLNGKDQDVLGGSFTKLTTELQCIALSKVDKINIGARIQVNIENVKILSNALARCNGNAICINNLKKQISQIQNESKKLGSQVREATKKIIICSKNLSNLANKLFNIKNIAKKLIKSDRKSLRAIREIINKSYLFKTKL